MSVRRSLAACLACAFACLTSLARQEASPPLGVVTSASRAHTNSAEVTTGATLYEGDRLQTEAQGSLGLSSPNGQLNLSENSIVLIRHSGSALSPNLEKGTVEFSTKAATSLEVQADDVRVRAAEQAGPSGQTVGRVTLRECDITITSVRESLVATVGGETKTIESGKTYRVQRDLACGAVRSGRAPLSPGHSHFELLAIIATATITVLAIRKALESPDHP
ncbi:MAG: hypothetical protein NVS9B4_14950 [Candidatus Acidiferrum sp.]